MEDQPAIIPGEFAFVTDAVTDDQGCYYIGEYNASDRIQKFDPDGNFLTQWGGPGFEPGELNGPWGVVIDSKDRVHILDSSNHRVQRVRLPI